MKTLKTFLSEAGISQAELARQVGVSAVAVGYWVSGRSMAPQRAEAVAAALGLPPEDLRHLTQMVGELCASEYTVLGHLLASDAYSSHIAAHVPGRTLFLAEVLGVGVGEVREYVSGGRLLDLGQTYKLAKLWPGLNPVAFAAQTAAPMDEAGAVADFLRDGPVYTSFDSLRYAVSKAHADWLFAESRPMAPGLLDDGRPLPPSVAELMGRLGGHGA